MLVVSSVCASSRCMEWLCPGGLSQEQFAVQEIMSQRSQAQPSKDSASKPPAVVSSRLCSIELVRDLISERDMLAGCRDRDRDRRDRDRDRDHRDRDPRDHMDRDRDRNHRDKDEDRGRRKGKDDGLSVGETNAMRAKLGLKPLK